MIDPTAGAIVVASIAGFTATGNSILSRRTAKRVERELTGNGDPDGVEVGTIIRRMDRTMHRLATEVDNQAERMDHISDRVERLAARYGEHVSWHGRGMPDRRRLGVDD